jgi:hypothetical protein
MHGMFNGGSWKWNFELVRGKVRDVSPGNEIM